MLFFYILCVAQIVLESLPVSSSGHLELITQLSCEDIFDSNFCDLKTLAYTIDVLHICTMIIVGIFFFRSWFEVLTDIKHTYKKLFLLFATVLFADVITVGWYVFFKMFPLHFPLWIGFFFTGLILFSLRFVPTVQDGSFGWYQAGVLGMVQGIALLPGISRFGTVFVASRWLGFSNKKAFALMWLIQMPLILGAVAKASLWFYVRGIPISLKSAQTSLPIFLGATVVGYVFFWGVAQLVYRNKLWIFSFYMILPLLLSFYFLR